MYIKSYLFLATFSLCFSSLEAKKLHNESINKQEINKTNKQEMLSQLKNATRQYIKLHNLAQDSKVTVSVQNNLALINNSDKQEAIAIFEIPQELSRQGLTEAEAARIKELFEVYESSNFGKYKIIKFKYRDKKILPEDEKQAIILLYAPNLILEKDEEQDSEKEERKQSKIFDVLNKQQLEALINAKHINYPNFESARETLVRRTAIKKIKQEGIDGATFVKTDKEPRIKIENLKVGNKICSRDPQTGQETFHEVTYLDHITLPKYIEITFKNKKLADQPLKVASDHKLYIASLKTFVTAQELKENPALRLMVNPTIKEVKEVHKSLDVVRITVDEVHNFSITEGKLLAHNFDPTIVIMAGEAIMEYAAPITYGALSIFLGYLGWKQTKNNHPDRHFDQLHQQTLSPTPVVSSNQFCSPAPGSVVSAILPQSYQNSQQRDSQSQNSNSILQEKSKENKPSNKQSETQKKSEGGGSQQPSKEPDDKDKKKKDNNKIPPPPLDSKKRNENNQHNPNGKYEDAPYHHKNSSGQKSHCPMSGQKALDNSVRIKDTSPHRISVSDDEFVVLNQTQEGLFHGHVRPWDELTRSMKDALIDAGKVTRSGKIIR